MKLWKTPVPDRERSRAIAAELGISPFAAMLLVNRGMTDAEACREFLEAGTKAYVDPMTLPDMGKAVARIEKALEKGENITVFGDYDVDGITATALLYTYLSDRGAAVRYMLPSRDDGGYGLNTAVVDRMNADGTELIVTVDNGISAGPEIAYARSFGIDTVVTDHHKPPETLPGACAVVDAFTPAGAELPFREWAGVGIAYKLACALEMSRRGTDDSEAVGVEMAERFGGLAALGSIADIVPLTGENRRLTAAGIRRLREAPSPGLLALMNASRLDRNRLRAADVAFSLAPRINSAGRMGSPYRALELLLCENASTAYSLAEKLSAVNASRSMQEQAVGREIWDELKKDPAKLYEKVAVLCGKGWNTGILGIFASRLCEKIGKPAIVLSVLPEDEGLARGSGRCFGGFSLYKALTACGDLLELYGGHSQAAGLTIRTENIPRFAAAINRYADLFGEMPAEELVCDCELHPGRLDVGLIKECSILEPFGAGTPQPLIILRDLTVTEITPLTNGRHHRITAQRDGTAVTMMYFNSDSRYMRYRTGDRIDTVVAPDIDTYTGQEKLKLIVKDIRPSGLDAERVIYETRCFESLMLGKDITEEQRMLLLPERKHIADAYRMICANGYAGTKEILIHRALERGIGCGQLLTALEALSSAGIISKQDLGDAWQIEPRTTESGGNTKKDLNECDVIKALGGLKA